MSIRRRPYRFGEPGNPAVAEFSDFSGGLNTRDSELTVKDNELTVANNIRYGAQGSLATRPGSVLHGQTIGTTTKILGLHSYVKKDLTAELLTTFNTDIYRYTESNATATVNNGVTTASGTGYSKDRHVFMTSANLDASGNPYTVIMYQSGSAITLEWEDSPYDTWTNTAISVNASTQLGFSAVMDSSDNIYVAFMSDANTTKFLKLTYGAGPTWSVGTAVTVKGSGASDSATSPTIVRQSNARLHIGYRYYNGTNYEVRAVYSDDAGTTWSSETTISTASTNARHFAALVTVNNVPVIFYQVGEVGATSYYYRFWTGSWSSQALAETSTDSTDRAFSAATSGSTLHYAYTAATSSSGLGITTFGTSTGASRRRYGVVNDGANDNDITYFSTIAGSEDSTATRVTNDANNNLSPSMPQSVSASSSYVPVMWITGTGSPYTIKINSTSKWFALTASLTTNKAMESTYFPSTSAGGTDQIYFTNGTDTAKKWDGTTLTAAHADWPKPKWIVHYENRLWMGNYGTTQNRVIYTNLGTDGFGAALPAGNIVDLPEQTLWGHAYYTKLLIFTRAAIYVVENFDYSGAAVGPESARIRKMPNSFGTLSGRTVKQVGYWVYFQSPDGMIRRTNGQYVELVSGKLSGTIANLATAQLTTASAGTLNDTYYLAVAESGSGNANIWVVLDTKMYDRNGGGFSIDTGKETSCFVTHPDSAGFPQLFYGSSDTGSGSVYQGETRTSDNGTAIAVDVQTGVKAFGSSYRRKHFKNIQTLAAASGDYNLTVGYSTFANLTSFTIYTVDLDPAAPVWGAFVWGSFVWGGNSNIDDSEEINVYDRMLKYRFTQSGVDQPIELFGFCQTYTIIDDKR